MHFTVLVVGENPEEQMEPFCEDLQTVMDFELKEKQKTARPWNLAKVETPAYELKYLMMMDVAEERRKEFMDDVAAGKNHEDTFEEYLFEYYRRINFVPKTVYLTFKHHDPGYNQLFTFGHRFAVVNENGDIEHVFDCYVKNPKWDWYVLGGRWKNFFKVKPEAVSKVRYDNIASLSVTTTEWLEKSLIKALGGKAEFEVAKEGYADQLTKSDLDLEGMRAEAKVKGEKFYDGFHALIGNEPIVTFDEYLAEASGDYRKAGELYHASPMKKLIQGSGYQWAEEKYFVALKKPREEFLDWWGVHPLATHSILYNGTWIESETYQPGDWSKGEMGKFVPFPGDWDKHISDFIDSLPGNTLLSLFDYHS